MFSRIADLIRELVMDTPPHNQLLIIATALNAKALHPKLNHNQSVHLFTTELSIPVLNKVSIYFPSYAACSMSINTLQHFSLGNKIRNHECADEEQ